MAKGLRWRISDGKYINVLIGPWIPNNNGFIPKKIHGHRNLDLVLSDSIDKNMHSWEIQELNPLFEVEDVSAILSIPISIAGSNDRFIWHYTKIGNYEVKSIYDIAKDLIGKTLKNSKAQVSCHSFPKSFWYFSWKLGDKHKHKFFLRKCYPY